MGTEQVQDHVSSGIVRFGAYEIDRRDGKLSKHGFRIKLSGQPLEVLLLLLARPGDLVSREDIRQRLWAGDVFVDFERSLNSAVKKLRRALNDDPQQPRYIETEPRKGYRFIATVEPVSGTFPRYAPAEQPGVNAPQQVSPQVARSGHSIVQSARGALSSFTSRGIMAVAVVLVVASAVIFYRSSHKLSVSASGVVSKNAAFRSSIAVLGFRNLSSNRDTDWLSTAITQMLSTELANAYKVRIIPEEIVSRAKINLGMKEKDGYTRETLRALRSELGTDYAVAGSYLALGDRNSGQVRMDLRLQETISGETLASIAVTGKPSEIFDMVNRAGRQMRTRLGVTVPPDGDIDWRSVLPANPEAARLYAEGMKQLRVLENLAAGDLLEKSLLLEPDFALGHAALADALSALGSDARAIASAQKALSLSSSLPEDERMEIEGRCYELKHDWLGAISAYRHLLQDFPDDVESGLKLAAAQTASGNLNEALATLSSLRSQTASERDDPRIDLEEASLAARSTDYKRQRSLAEQAARKARISNRRLVLAHAQLLRGDALHHQFLLEEAAQSYWAAQQIFQSAGDREGTAVALIGLAAVLQKQGDLGSAREKLAQATDYFRQVGDNTALTTALTTLREISRAQDQLAQQKNSSVNR